jgi:hypothetical protein
MKHLAVSLVAAATLSAGLLATPAALAQSHQAAPASAAAAARPMLGVDLYATSNYSAANVTSYGDRMLPYIKHVLKANAVSIVWNLYDATMTSDTVTVGKSTLSAANVGILTRIAERDGLRVVFRPLIVVTGGNRGHWEGNITPASQAKWFASYYKVELPYLKIAQQFKIAEFVAETEMHAMNTSRGWAGYFRRLAKVYRGVVSYASWDRDYFPPHLLPVSAVGLDFYEDMPKLSGSASEAQVLAGWESWFKRVPESLLRRTTMQEVGIAAASGSYADPAMLAGRGRLDQNVQANWFTAACKVVRKYDMGGVFFWKVDLADNPSHPTSALSVFEGRKGATAIANCAKILG